MGLGTVAHQPREEKSSNQFQRDLPELITAFDKVSLPACVCLLISLCFSTSQSRAEPRLIDTSLTVFGGAHVAPSHRNPHISYNLDPASERYLLYVPTGYTGSESYGLIAFTDSEDQITRLPAGWQSILDSRKYIFVAAQNAGNDQARGRRLGLAVLGVMKVIEKYRVDSNRVYAAGFSGGARMAGLLGFYQSDIFRGTLQNSGADFYKPVPLVESKSRLDTAGQPYGLLAGSATSEEIEQARNVRFVLITGTNDFRRGNILDIFHGGFERNGFQVKLFDIRELGHEICDGDTLSRALDFLEKGD